MGGLFTSVNHLQEVVCIVGAKRETWFKLKSLASASLTYIPVAQVQSGCKVSTCRGMESTIYPNELYLSVIGFIIQDGFKIESTLSIDKLEYLILTSV